jgi:hypothetical protein
MQPVRTLLLMIIGILPLGPVYALPLEAMDTIEVKRLGWEIADLVTDTANQERNMLTYVYFGYPGWSKPEVRVTVGKDANPAIEYLELSMHSRFVAFEMTVAGETDARKSIPKYAKYWIKTDAEHCPKAKRTADELENLVVQQILEDRKDKRAATTVRTDGGAKHVFRFGTSNSSAYGITLFDREGPLVKKIREMKTNLIACKANN